MFGHKTVLDVSRQFTNQLKTIRARENDEYTRQSVFSTVALEKAKLARIQVTQCDKAIKNIHELFGIDVESD